MVIGYHLIWTAYGCWLANDPRGSSSLNLRVEKFAPLGPVHRGRKPQQPNGATLRDFYRQAEQLLEHSRPLFEDADVALIAASFARSARERGYLCYACTVMPDHVHVVAGRHPDRAEGILAALQQTSKRALIEAGRRPVNHPVWGGHGWKVFLNTPAEVCGRIRYVEENPEKAGRPAQRWDFVMPYDGLAGIPGDGGGA